MSVLSQLWNLFTGLALQPEPATLRERSSLWPAVRAKHLRKHPECEACGARRRVQVHHVEPVNVRPELELEPANLWTLCEQCHLVLGHLGDWRRWNPEIREDSVRYRLQVERADARIGR